MSADVRTPRQLAEQIIRAEAAGRLPDFLFCTAHSNISDLARALIAAEDVLKRYGRHDPECCFDHPKHWMKGCTCGLFDAVGYPDSRQRRE